MLGCTVSQKCIFSWLLYSVFNKRLFREAADLSVVQPRRAGRCPQRGAPFPGASEALPEAGSAPSAADGTGGTRRRGRGRG